MVCLYTQNTIRIGGIRMHSARMRRLAAALAMLMLISCFGGTALAAGGKIGDKTASPTVLTDANRDTTVTLRLPSEEYKNKVDVVFVMDNSTSVANSGINFADQVSSLFEGIVEKNPSIDLKVAVIKFRGYATDMLGSGLTAYEGNESKIRTAIANNNVPGSGTNAHSGLVMADQFLTADGEVPDANKYVVFLTDGKNYIWNNKANEPVTIYAQWHKNQTVQSGGAPVVAQLSAIYNKEAGQRNPASPNIYNSYPGFANDLNLGPISSDASYYQRLYDSTSAELTSASVYEFPCYYSKYYSSYTGTGQPTGTLTKIVPDNATTAIPNNYSFYRTYYQFVPDENSVWKGLKFLTINPYLLSGSNYDTSNPDPDFFLLHTSSMEKGCYMAGHAWSDLDSKYKTGSVVYYKEGSGGGTNICRSFTEWVAENSDYGAHIASSDEVLALFEDIDNSITYLVDEGSSVEDVIASEFDLKESENPFTIKVNGTTQAVSKKSDNIWAFGTPVDGAYPYEVAYDAGSRTIIWKINVPVKITEPVTLSYVLTLKKEYTDGTYDTNESAVLDYRKTDGSTGTFVFPKPKVSIKAPAPVPEIPLTEDSNRPVLYVCLALAAGCAAVWLVVRGVRRGKGGKPEA